MKRLSTIIMALAVIFGMTQCEKPAMQLYDGSYTGVTKDITFSTGGSSKVTVDNSIASELHFKWQGTDNLYVYGSQLGDFSDGQYCGSLALVKGAGTENGFFSGTLDNVPTSGKLRFYYSATALDGTEKSIDLSSQNGSLPGIASHLVAYADVTVMESGDYSATLAVPYSVVKLDLHEFGSCDVTMTGTTNSGLTINEHGVKGVTGGTSTTLSGVTSESNAYYVAVMPESVTTLNFSGNGLVGSKSVTLSENRFETLNGGGSGVPVPAAEPVEGDDWINFNDPAMGVEGLPIWSKYNLGVDKSNLDHAYDWYGDYYAWGEVEPYYTSITWNAYDVGSADGWQTGKTAGYDWGSYRWCSGDWNTLTKYNTDSYYGTVDNKTILEDADDAACHNATPANPWRMPTGGDGGEWQQLKFNTLFVWTNSYKGISNLAGYVAYKVKLPEHTCQMEVSEGNGETERSGVSYNLTDPHLFLPAAGGASGDQILGGIEGYYWASTLEADSPEKAQYAIVRIGESTIWQVVERRYGFSVRGVR